MRKRNVDLLSGGVNTQVGDIAKSEWHGDIKVHTLNPKYLYQDLCRIYAYFETFSLCMSSSVTYCSHLSVRFKLPAKLRHDTFLKSATYTAHRSQVCVEWRLGVWSYAQADKKQQTGNIEKSITWACTCFRVHPVEIIRPLEAGFCDQTSHVTGGATLLLCALEKTISPPMDISRIWSTSDAVQLNGVYYAVLMCALCSVFVW